MQTYLRDESLQAPMRKVLEAHTPFVYDRFLLNVMRKKQLLLKGRTE
jgi:hypothetical protein